MSTKNFDRVFSKNVTYLMCKKKKTLYYIYYVIYKLKIKEQSNNAKINLS